MADRALFGDDFFARFRVRRTAYRGRFAAFGCFGSFAFVAGSSAGVSPVSVGSSSPACSVPSAYFSVPSSRPIVPFREKTQKVFGDFVGRGRLEAALGEEIEGDLRHLLARAPPHPRPQILALAPLVPRHRGTILNRFPETRATSAVAAARRRRRRGGRTGGCRAACRRRRSAPRRPGRPRAGTPRCRRRAAAP